MASIANASNAYVSAGNGNAYSLMPKFYIGDPNGTSGHPTDAYIKYDSQGNFIIKGAFQGGDYISGHIYYPISIFAYTGITFDGNHYYISFINKPQIASLVDSNGNNVQNLTLYDDINTNIQFGSTNNLPIPSGTYYFTVTGQAQLAQHLI